MLFPDKSVVEKKESEEMKQIWNTIKIINHPFKKQVPKPDKEEEKEESEKESSEESEEENLHIPSIGYVNS
jgi:hypothetical protein